MFSDEDVMLLIITSLSAIHHLLGNGGSVPRSCYTFVQAELGEVFVSFPKLFKSIAGLT